MQTQTFNKTNTYVMEQYSERSFAVRGDTKNIKEKLMELGGKYNPNLKRKDEQGNEVKFAGWIFSLKHEQKVKEYLNSLI